MYIRHIQANVDSGHCCLNPSEASEAYTLSMLDCNIDIPYVHCDMPYVNSDMS